MRTLTFLLISSLVLAGCGPEEEATVIEYVGEYDAVDGVPELFQSADSDAPTFTVIADNDDSVQLPNDLEFHPDADRADELWILNEGTSGLRGGGTTVTLYNAGQDDQEADHRKDGNAGHFMAKATSLAFSDNGNWATGCGVVDANYSGGTYAGPSLWSSDMEIYAQVGDPPSAEVNGSHLDMLHGSPFSMGMAHEEGNAFWVFDGHHGHLARYDFQVPHPPGGSDHSNGLVHRYKEVEIAHHEGVPSHMLVDKDTGWLYVNDTGNQRIIRMNTDSGTMLDDLGFMNETLEEHWEMHEAEWEVFADEALEEPSGMALSDGRLFVSDHATGDIIAYDVDTGEKLAKVEAESGIRGITVGPDNKLWIANYNTSQVLRLDPQ